MWGLEQKRKIIGGEFIRVFEEEARKLDGKGSKKAFIWVIVAAHTGLTYKHCFYVLFKCVIKAFPNSPDACK